MNRIAHRRGAEDAEFEIFSNDELLSRRTLRLCGENFPRLWHCPAIENPKSKIQNRIHGWLLRII